VLVHEKQNAAAMQISAKPKNRFIRPPWIGGFGFVEKLSLSNPGQNSK
jgi:hypothetical protein